MRDTEQIVRHLSTDDEAEAWEQWLEFVETVLEESESTDRDKERERDEDEEED